MDKFRLGKSKEHQRGVAFVDDGGRQKFALMKTKSVAVSSNRLFSQFRISVAMRPYVLRIRLRGPDFDFGSDPERAAAFTKCVREMRRILVEKRHIPALAADRAILKTLEAALDFQSADLRYRVLKMMEVQSQSTLDNLIRGLRELSNAIAQSPPTSRGKLNERVLAIIDQTPFDSETFIEIIESISATLPEIAPRRLADDIFSLIHSEPAGARRPLIVDQWEAMPATTRVTVEGMVQAIPSGSLVRWLNAVAGVLDRERPAHKRGAPRSITRVFVSRVAAIWRTLGLNPGLAYDFFLHPATDDRVGRGGRIESAFQRYCRAALTAVGDFREVSARQVVNYKKNTGASRRR
jgi:hypothetical protein